MDDVLVVPASAYNQVLYRINQPHNTPLLYNTWYDEPNTTSVI